MLRQSFGRRDVLTALLSAGVGMAGSGLAALPARAATGKVVFGFPRGNVGFPFGAALLQEIHRNGSYQPDLGTDVVHLPGNAGVNAIRAVFNAAADGSTVLLAPSSTLTLLPLMRPMAPIEPTRDFVPVAAVCSIGAALAVGPRVPAQVTTLKEYAAWARQKPEQCAYGVPGLGSMPHFIGLVLAEAMEVPLVPVVYNAPVTIAADLAAGSLPAGMLVTGNALQAAMTAGVRLIAVSTKERWPSLPDVPTMREAGVGADRLPPLETYGFFMHAATPAAKVAELGDAIRQALRSPAMAEALVNSWNLPLPDTADGYPAQIARERASWVGLVKSQHFSNET